MAAGFRYIPVNVCFTEVENLSNLLSVLGQQKRRGKAYKYHVSINISNFSVFLCSGTNESVLQGVCSDLVIVS